MFNQNSQGRHRSFVRPGIILFLLVAVGLWLLTTISVVQRGEVKVVTQFGAVTGRILDPGLNFKKPWPIESTLTYNTKLVTYETSPGDKQASSEADYTDFPVDTNTSDGQKVDISYTIRFSTNPERAAWCAQNIGTELALVEKIVKTESRIWFRNIPRNYDAETTYTGQGSQQIQEEVAEILRPKFEDTCLRLDTVGVREIDWDPNFVSAISEKQVEEVKIATEQNKALQAIEIKNRRITEAEADQAVQELQRESITPLLLQKIELDNQKFYLEIMKEKWKGDLPLYLGGNSGLLPTLPVQTPQQ